LTAKRTAGPSSLSRQIPEELVTQAVDHLRKRDRTLRRIITAHGPFALELKTDAFPVLVQSIISQQISTAAAASIRRRVDALRGRRKLTAGWVLDQSDEQLRSCGISPQKLRYLRDLADKVDTRTVNLAKLPLQSDEDVIAELTQVLGVGVWTAQMFLIFSLGRLDVLPTGDLGIRAAIEREYQLPAHPTPRQCEELAAPWRPFASFASWYLWRSSDVKLTPEQREMWK
jgi:DNA-3-methyladenine glycosylase II